MSDLITLFAMNLKCYIAHPIVVFSSVIQSGTWLRPATPRTIVEKFLWRKLFDRNPLFTTACDKMAAKAYVVSLYPQLKTAQILWSGSDPETIPFEMLNRHTVLKANHGSGWNILEPHKSARAEIIRHAARWMNSRFGRKLGEWGYKDVPRRILLEEALFEEDQLVGTEYKFHVSGGTTAYVFLKLNRPQHGNTRYVLNRNGEAFIIDDSGCRPFEDFKLADNYAELRRLAERLAKPFDFVRCDFYNLPDGIYFSELTVYPMSGHGNIGHPELVGLRNSMWDLRKSWFLATTQRGLNNWYANSLRRWLDNQDKSEVGTQTAA